MFWKMCHNVGVRMILSCRKCMWIHATNVMREEEFLSALILLRTPKRCHNFQNSPLFSPGTMSWLSLEILKGKRATSNQPTKAL